MAQFDFYCLAKDYPEIVNSVCEHAAWGVMPCWHPKQEIPIYHGYSAELRRAIATNKRLYIVGPFSTHGVCVEKTVHGNYAIAMEKWGPLIALTLGGSRLESNSELVWGGDVWCRPWYETRDGHQVKPTGELKTAYAEIVKRIKRICRRIHVRKWVYATKEVCQLLEDGKGKIQVNGKWVGFPSTSK